MPFNGRSLFGVLATRFGVFALIVGSHSSCEGGQTEAAHRIDRDTFPSQSSAPTATISSSSSGGISSGGAECCQGSWHAPITQLADIDLSKNHISDISPLSQLKSLRDLELEDNAIADFAALADANLPLKGGYLWISGNPFVRDEQLECFRRIMQRSVNIRTSESCKF